jgi:hypothetical protein
MAENEGSVVIDGQKFAKGMSDADIAFVLNHKRTQGGGALPGSPMAALAPPGAGMLQPGLGAIASVGTLGGVSPAPTSPEQVMVEGAASVASMYGAGVGTRIAENIGAKLLASGFGDKMVSLMVKPLFRIGGAAAGGATGSVTHSAGSAVLGLEGAPKDVTEAASRAQAAAAANAMLQGGFEVAIPAAQMVVGKLWNGIQKAAMSSKTAVNAKKLESMKTELTERLKASHILEIKDAQAQEIQKVTGEIVNEMGLARAPEQMADLGKTIETRVTAKLDQRMKPIYQELDSAAEAAGTKVDASPIGEKILALAAKEPRGPGVAKPFTKPSPRFSEIVREASSGQKGEEFLSFADKEGKPVLQKIAPGKEAPQELKDAFRIVLDAKNKEIGLDAMMKARGTISREIANPATDDETRGLLKEILKPWDQTIKSGLAEINPGLAVKWDVAQDLWHKGKIIQDKVVMERLRNAGARSLVSEIQPNAPRNVEQMRLLFNEAFPKPAADGMWKDLQRAKVEELMGTDLAGFGEKYRQYGNTMNRLFQTPEEKQTALRLVTLSDDFAHLQRNPSVKNDQKLEALKAGIAALENGASQKELGTLIAGFITKPHVMMYGSAALLGGTAYGTAGLAGGMLGMAGAEAIGRKAIPAIIKAAEHPYEANKLIQSLNAFIKDGNPNTAANLSRSLYAAYKTGEAVNTATEMKASH